MKKTEIRFIKPCRGRYEDHRQLTPEYAQACLQQGKVVQINLDNCSLQRMEQLPDNPSLADAEDVGLLPLIRILQQAPGISLAAVGFDEMPDKYIAQSIKAYQNFCDQFWPEHQDDIEASYRNFDPCSTNKKVDFKALPDEARSAYGDSYIAMLHIQNIKLNYAGKSPEEQFEIYLHSMINLLDMVSAFDMEIAKYAFWRLSAKVINQLPDLIQNRLRDVKSNFAKKGSTLDKCRWLAFDAAMDIYWLSASNLTEDLDVKLNANGNVLAIDNWVGTNDHKLFNICSDIHWVYHDNSTMKQLSTTRETTLSRLPYWQYVDQLADNIMKYRKDSGYNHQRDYLKRVDTSVAYIEQELSAYFDSISDTAV